MAKGRDNWLLTPSAMGEVDAAAAASGIDSFGLMEKAGQAVAAAVLKLFPAGERFVVLCGPGNNGGDGYVAARALQESGAAIALYHLGDPSKLKGDAATARSCCPVPAEALETYFPMQGDVIVDAIFGAGLARSVPPVVVDIVRRVDEAGLPVVAVDLPSGIDGRTGAVMGAAFKARHTVTFMTRKPGHLLLPGRLHCGSVETVDIGIPFRLVEAKEDRLFVNGPQEWRTAMPTADAAAHKFRRGHLTVFSGPVTATGAARLAAAAGLKAGAGLVTIASPADAVAANAAHLTAVMLKAVETENDLADYLRDERRSVFVLGPGFGVGPKACVFTAAIAAAGRHLVLDADGITAFAEDPHPLFSAFAGGASRLVLTPHEGEFARLFPDLADDPALSKVDRARQAAARANAAVVYKGADSVIAAPDGRAVINENAPASLATAGSGDVLAGIIGGLLAQGVPAFEAAAAGVWLHGDAASKAGASLTAETLINHIDRWH